MDVVPSTESPGASLSFSRGSAPLRVSANCPVVKKGIVLLTNLCLLVCQCLKLSSRRSSAFSLCAWHFRPQSPPASALSIFFSAYPTGRRTRTFDFIILAEHHTFSINESVRCVVFREGGVGTPWAMMDMLCAVHAKQRVARSRSSFRKWRWIVVYSCDAADD